MKAVGCMTEKLLHRCIDSRIWLEPIKNILHCNCSAPNGAFDYESLNCDLATTKEKADNKHYKADDIVHEQFPK
jgi:hypothetical protein